MNKLIFLAFLSLTMLSCKEDDASTSSELLAQMEAVAQEIEAMIATSCSNNDQCRATPMGVKPCGGPTKFIVHSSATDQGKLDALIEQYNELNTKYNTVAEVGSDCSVVTAPEVDCVMGNCQAVVN